MGRKAAFINIQGKLVIAVRESTKFGFPSGFGILQKIRISGME